MGGRGGGLGFRCKKWVLLCIFFGGYENGAKRNGYVGFQDLPAPK